MTFRYTGSVEKQAVVDEEKVSQSRTFLTYKDTPDLARSYSMLNKTMETFRKK